jgi:hypothetical protein
MRFPDPSTPIATCAAADCVDCPAAQVVHCHFRLKDFLVFALAWIPGFVVGVAGILAFGAWPLAGWGALIIVYFGFVEIRVMCSHCPHYAEDGLTLSCWGNHGIPKPWKYRPGPMSAVEKIVFLGGLAIAFGYPLIFLVLGRQWLLLALYALASAGFFATLKLLMCSQCMNFACPLNSVGEAARDLFFERNPSVATHWRKPTSQ